MRSYIAFQNQINGFEDVAQTTKTVEKIAASSVHFLRGRVSNLNKYADETERALARLNLFHSDKGNPLLNKKATGKNALVVLAGDKGLVGGLWHDIVGAAAERSKKDELVIAIGKKGRDYLEEEGLTITKFISCGSEIMGEEEIQNINSYLFEGFKKGSFARVDILYPKFQSLASQVPHFARFLPFDFTSAQAFAPQEEHFDQKNQGLPVFEPSRQKIFDDMLGKYIGVMLRKIILEAKLSELSARTVAMEHATAKTQEIIKKLQLKYAKNRRRIVTQRQLESFAAHKA